jgi:hypothetical protein
MAKRDDEQDERDAHNFNQGRINCDSKWADAIDERIKELEEQVGIPELRRLKKKVKYGWHINEEEMKQGKWVLKKLDDD